LFKAKKLVLTLWAVLQPINLYLVDSIRRWSSDLGFGTKLWVGGKFALWARI